MKIRKKDLSQIIESFLFEAKEEEISDEEQQLVDNIGEEKDLSKVYAIWKTWSENNKSVKHKVPDPVLNYFNAIGYDLKKEARLSDDTKTSWDELMNDGHISKFSNLYKVYIDKLDNKNKAGVS